MLLYITAILLGIALVFWLIGVLLRIAAFLCERRSDAYYHHLNELHKQGKI